MECCKCGRGIEHGLAFVPIDPPGTSGRRWICEECSTPEQWNGAPRSAEEAIEQIANQ